jgi:photosystem II stability/assembly factor-like uncharacterized protein
MPFFIRPLRLWLSSLVAVTVITLAAGFAQAADLTQNYVWKPVRIGAGGWMRGMAIDPMHPSVRYARGDVDNLYRWDDQHKVWIPTKVASAFPANIAAAPVNAGCGAIAIDPLNPKVVLCAYTFRRSADIEPKYPSLGLNVYRSADGGRTFTPGNLSLKGDLSGETAGERLAFDPNNDSIAYFGSPSDGLWRSTDGGRTWAHVDLGQPITDARLPRFDPGAGTVLVDGRRVSKRIYLTTGSGTVLTSDDGGDHWRNISAGVGIDGHAGFAMVDSVGWLWVVEDGTSRVWRYPRSGEWTPCNTTHGGLDGIAVDPRNPNRVFVISQGGALARSSDAGAHWTDLGQGLKFSETQPIEWLRPSAIRPQGHYISLGGIYMDVNGALWVPGANDGILTAGTNDAMDTSSNPPVWSSVSEGIEEMVGEEIALPPGGKPVLSVEDETLFTISDPDQFTAQHFSENLWENNDGLSSAQDISYCPNQPRFLVVTSDNLSTNPQLATSHFSSYSQDGGQTWHRFSSITDGAHPCVLYDGIIAVSARPAGHENDSPGRDDIVWVGSNYSGLNSPAPFYSFDGGATWTQTHSFDHAPGASMIQACGQSYVFMGQQWGSWNPSLSEHNLVADPKVPGLFYLHLVAGGFWRSTDGGVTWTKTAGSDQIAGFAHHGRLAANPYASGDLWFIDGYEGATQHGLWHSTDGGDSFVKIAGFDFCWALALGKSVHEGGYPAIYVYGKRTGNDRWGIFRSTDKAKTWDQISGYPTGLLDIPAGMAASWDHFGLVYLGFRGNSFVYGYPTK